MRRLTKTEVRPAAVAAQGLASSRPSTTPNLGHLRRAVRTMGILQIDSVNVVGGAHHLTLFSRLGPHDPDLLLALEDEQFPRPLEPERSSSGRSSTAWGPMKCRITAIAAYVDDELMLQLFRPGTCVFRRVGLMGYGE